MASGWPVGGSPSAADEGGRRFDSWKEIAAYFGRDVRTVRRWETNEALPVHRHLHRSRGSVYAYQHELDHWRVRRSLPGGADPPARLRLPPRSAGLLGVALAMTLTGSAWVLYDRPGLPSIPGHVRQARAARPVNGHEGTRHVVP